jgi:hypothetical protein
MRGSIRMGIKQSTPSASSKAALHKRGLVQSGWVKSLEPFLDEETQIWIVTNLDNPRIIKLEDLRKEDDIKYELAKERVAELQKRIKLPGDPRPYLDNDDPSLQKDLICYCFGYDEGAKRYPIVELPEKHEEAVVNWLICTWTAELFSKYPRLMILGLTEAGKGRLLTLVQLLGYRGFKGGSPTPSVLYREVEEYGTTHAIEELESSDKELYRAIMQFWRLGFDGDPITRSNKDNAFKTDIFSPRAFMAASFKERTPREDDINRSIVLQMQKNQKKVDPNEPEDNDDFRRFRARLLAYRINIMAGRNIAGLANARTVRDEVDEKLNEPILIDGKLVELTGRARIHARCLMFPGLIFKAYDDTLSVISSSRKKAVQKIQDKFATQAALALVQLFQKEDLPPLPEADTTRYWGKNIATVLLDNLQQQGTLEDYHIKEGRDGPKPPTKRTIDALELYGFKFKDGKGGMRYIEPASFEENYPKMLKLLTDLGIDLHLTTLDEKKVSNLGIQHQGKLDELDERGGE